MIDWNGAEEAACAVPAGRLADDLVRELSDALTDPDPLVQDGAPPTVTTAWIARGTIGAARRLSRVTRWPPGSPTCGARPAPSRPLVLDMLVTAGDLRSGWVDAFERWCPAERDLRGQDPELGRLHAVAPTWTNARPSAGSARSPTGSGPTASGLPSPRGSATACAPCGCSTSSPTGACATATRSSPPSPPSSTGSSSADGRRALGRGRTASRAACVRTTPPGRRWWRYGTSRRDGAAVTHT
ncbi:hypothetical protein KSE_63205 [Kitasatospora setae KM-6054]|uniref:Uncharacterized protein n=1 Tax=Kitasatospora setae (strain ATCC 33774 / DSM 43861 / JCM 3304 / KCC A-0304 / NBRC 14216 / KM-6054) TaxID=452652 RepID=E4N1P5_KITSK|nr:hypothetical protein KSE_63205 [Kitasatospora setae KM-6054]